MCIVNHLIGSDLFISFEYVDVLFSMYSEIIAWVCHSLNAFHKVNCGKSKWKYIEFVSFEIEKLLILCRNDTNSIKDSYAYCEVEFL